MLYAKDQRNYHIVKIDMATGQVFDFTEEDAKQLLEQEAQKEYFEEQQKLVNETATKLRHGDYER